MSQPFRNAFDSRYIKHTDARAMLSASGWKKNKLNKLWHKKTRNPDPELEPRFYTLREALEIHYKNTDAA